MRIFGEEEKRFISYLVISKRGQRNIIGYMDEYLNRTRIKINFETSVTEFIFEITDIADNNEIEWVTNKLEELIEQVSLLTKTIEYLEKNNFVVIYGATPDKFSGEVEFGQGADNNLTSPYNDEAIAKLLTSYIYKEIVPLAPLRELENNKFKSQDERRFKMQIIVAWVAITVSLILGLSGIAFNFYSLNKNKDKYITEIEENNSSIEVLINNDIRLGVKLHDTQKTVNQLKIKPQ